MRYGDGGECEQPGETCSGGNKFFTSDEDEVYHGFVFYYPEINICKIIEVEVECKADLD